MWYDGFIRWRIACLAIGLGAPTSSPRAVPVHIAQDAPANGRRDGMELIYAANGKEGRPNIVDSVRQVGLRDGATCATVFRDGQTSPASGPPEQYCARGDTLFTRDAASAMLLAQRPIGARMTMDFHRANGNRVHYSTDSTSRWTLGGRSYSVVHTTVLTADSTGRLVRRLTERYALALVTAVGGRFEAADSAATGGWRETQVFELRAIRERGRH